MKQKTLFFMIVFGSVLAAITFHEVLNQLSDEQDYTQTCSDSGGIPFVIDEEKKICLHPSAVIKVE